MAILYCDDGGSNTIPYDTWETAANLLETALNDGACVAGSTVYVASDHSQTVAGSLVLTGAGTRTAPVNVISVVNGDATTYQTMEAGGGIIATTAASGGDINISGQIIFVGVYLNSDDNFSLIETTGVAYHFIDCRLDVADEFISGNNTFDMSLIFENVKYVQTTNGKINIQGGSFRWSGGSYSLGVSGGTETGIFWLNNHRPGCITVEDVDIQDAAAGDYLVNCQTTDVEYEILFKRCKVDASLAGLINDTPTGEGFSAKFHSVSSADIVYQFQENYFNGQINEDTATYEKATYDGTNNYSIKMVSNANAIEFSRPLRFKLSSFYAAANPTLTVELNTDNIVLQNDEFWLEIEYPDSTKGALGTIDRSSKPTDILTAPANLTTSTAAWTEAFGTEKPQKVAVTIANGQAGIHTVWVCLAKPSTTVYVDPQVTIT